MKTEKDELRGWLEALLKDARRAEGEGQALRAVDVLEKAIKRLS